MVLEKTPESPLDSKGIKPVNLKGDQPWIFTGRTDAEAEALVFWSSDANRWLLGKSLMLGKIEGRRKTGHQRIRWPDAITDAMNMTLNLGKLREKVRDKWGLVYCSPWGHKGSDTIVQLASNTVALQCCVSFSCAAEWIRHAYTHIPSFWVAFLFRSWQRIEFPVLYSMFSIVIYLICSINSVYMLIPISQFFPLLFPPWYPYKRGQRMK